MGRAFTLISNSDCSLSYLLNGEAKYCLLYGTRYIGIIEV